VEREGGGAPTSTTGGWLTVLGSGTLVPDDTRHGAAHLIRTSSALVLMDCGPGTVHGFARYGVAWPDLTHVLITHYHNDHVGDLAALLQALKHGTSPRRTRPLHLVGPVGFRGFLQRLAAAMGPHVLDTGFDLHVVELGSGRTHRAEAAPLAVSCVSTPHTEESVAYRVELPGAAVGYTGDTGPSQTVASFLRGCDVLVAECTQADPPAMKTHLSPSGLAKLSTLARPGVLVVTHVAPPAVPEEAAGAVAAAWGGTVLAARDGLVIPLP